MELRCIVCGYLIFCCLLRSGIHTSRLTIHRLRKRMRGGNASLRSAWTDIPLGRSVDLIAADRTHGTDAGDAREPYHGALLHQWGVTSRTRYSTSKACAQLPSDMRLLKAQNQLRIINSMYTSYKFFIDLLINQWHLRCRPNLLLEICWNWFIIDGRKVFIEGHSPSSSWSNYNAELGS